MEFQQQVLQSIEALPISVDDWGAESGIIQGYSVKIPGLEEALIRIIREKVIHKSLKKK